MVNRGLHFAEMEVAVLVKAFNSLRGEIETMLFKSLALRLDFKRFLYRSWFLTFLYFFNLLFGGR